LAAPRIITIEELNRLLEHEDYVVIKREDDPNYCTIRFNSCGHTKLKTISSITNHEKRNSYCTECFEDNLSNILVDKGFTLLTKFKYGETKFSGEYRLSTCNNCGNFVFSLPSSIYSSNRLHCYLCEYNYYKQLAESKGYTLINRIDRYNLLLECRCGHQFNYQGSNLRRVTPRCPKCGKKDNGSYVYAFKIENFLGTFVKIGKSNNPYLRHINFSEGNDNIYTLIFSMKFNTESLAYRFEKELLRRYGSFRLSSEFSKLFIDSGFTEVFSSDILVNIIKED